MKRLLTFSNIRLVLEIVLIVVLVVVIIARPSISSAAPKITENSALASPTWYQCVTPDQVAAFTNRVHVHCTNVTGPTTVTARWFAVSTADSAMASRFMSIIQSAVLTTQPLYLYIDPNDLSGADFGCAIGDCRRLWGVELMR